MALADFKIRIIANACITRYTNGEGGIIAIVNSYNLASDDKESTLAHVYSKRPDINPETVEESLSTPAKTDVEGHEKG
ncbi:hypothetical protein [Paenibacillus sp. FJAT-26967]|uniref:hypothetical protein n=1 Tax=Paenibacillus sp. FJAT-26967 TaxID=1729690 RepID=UPI000838DE15|nr:hypothetical protein [Paenibacillus sp. FJAT-26967]